MMRAIGVCGATVLVIAFLFVGRAARAQMTVPGPNRFEIVQAGKKAGEIYVPSGQGRESYVEHWVLFDNYVYPGARSPITTEIRVVPTSAPYVSEADFFARVDWRSGFRYVRVDSTDTTTLPGRSP